MITRDRAGPGYAAGCQHAPPPLHVYDADAEHARWFPLRRPFLHPHHPGPVMVLLPQPPGSLFGDDPTDPTQCTEPRVATAGMIARLNVRYGDSSVTRGAVRR
jgi:hypothetical protein